MNFAFVIAVSMQRFVRVIQADAKLPAAKEMALTVQEEVNERNRDKKREAKSELQVK